MAYADYEKAKKMAEKQYRQAITRGAYPYLPVLEDLLRNGAGENRIPLGQIEIPIALIAGTASAERTTAFASNYMPLLDPDSEFGSKWSALFDSVQEQGVNDPIVAVEYMQRFYVVEGNKRVSVSKFNGAVRIDAEITRILPRQSDSAEYHTYMEFLEFYRLSGIYEILMSQPGQFPRLIRAVPNAGTLEHPEVWDDETRRSVRFLYSVFETHFLSRNGQRLPITTGEAFLHFLEIYGYAQLNGLTSAELNRRTDRIWAEFRVLADKNPSSHILNPTQASQRVALAKKLPLPSGAPLRIAFLYPKDPQSSGWSYNHEIGRRYLADTFGSAIETKAYICTPEPDDTEAAITQAIADGCRLIFTTSPAYHAVSMRTAVAHPEIILLNCSMNTSYKQLRTYYLRIYEAKFITGVIAGSMTENERIGYIADYPILGTPASISAFALGVKLVNPRAMVYLDWSTLEDHDPVAYFRQKQIDIISDRDINAPQDDDAGFGLYGLYGGTAFRLAAPVWNWGSLYADLVRSVLIGAWKNDSDENETHALHYYWGMSSGAIDVACSSRLPVGTKKLVRLVQDRLTTCDFSPFTGLIYDQSGNIRAAEGQTLTPEEIIRADWLPDNVVGRFAEVSELREPFREFALWHSFKPPEAAE